MYECAPIYVRLLIKRNPMTAVTTNKRPQRFFSSGSNLRFGGRQSNSYHGFSRVGQSRFFPRFSSTRKNMPAFNPAQLHVKFTRSMNLLSVCRRKLKSSTYTHCKLQPHKLSQCTLATRLSSS